MSCKIFGFLNFHISHLNYEKFKLCLKNTLNTLKTTWVYFGVLHPVIMSNLNKLGISPPVIMSNLNKLGLSPWGGGGGDLPHLAPPNARIFLFMLCNRETHFGRCPIFELTTHSPKMMNDHNHAPTPSTMRCSRAYETQHVISCQFTTCHIYKSWIIIFPTYNFHPSYIPCEYIKSAHINMISHTTSMLFTQATTRNLGL